MGGVSLYPRSMPGVDYSNLTDAQLQTMQANLLAAHERVLNAESYGIGARSLKRTPLKDIVDDLGNVGKELALRGFGADGGNMVVEFGEPV